MLKICVRSGYTIAVEVGQNLKKFGMQTLGAQTSLSAGSLAFKVEWLRFSRCALIADRMSALPAMAEFLVGSCVCFGAMLIKSLD